MPSQTAKSTALILGHLQEPIASMTTDPTYMGRVDSVVQSARNAGVQIIYVAITYRPSYVEIPAGHPWLEMAKPNQLFIDGVSNALHPALSLHDQDIIIRAPRVSGFYATDLELILRSMGITSLALAGIATGGVVMGTLTDARDRDFAVTVLEDLCFDPHPGVHEAILRAIDTPWAASVSSSADWLGSL
jgi:nicotinamidase-related amidase